MNLRNTILVGVGMAMVMVLAACAPYIQFVTPSPVERSAPTAAAMAPTSTAEPQPTPCMLPTIVPPTRPAEVPGYTELDPATGLHVTGRAPDIDLESYRLTVTGKVDNPLSLTYDELRCMPRDEVQCTLVCPGFFSDDASWAGVPVEHLLELAGVQEGANEVALTSADGYTAYFPLDEFRYEENILAYEWEGEPLPVLHGFPVRAVLPEMMGNRWVKWLVEVQVR